MSIDLQHVAPTRVVSKSSNTRNKQAGSPSFRLPALKRQKLSDKRKEGFFRELHTLTGAGMNLRDSFSILEEEANSELTVKLITQLKKKVVAGSSLSNAMAQSSHFTAYEYVSVQIGEESGRLHAVLQELSEFLGKKNQLRRQLISALTYPAFVLTIAVSVVYFMLTFIVPMFAGVFARFGGDLPYLTELIIDLSERLAASSSYLFLGFSGVGIFLFSNRQKEWFKRTTAKLMLGIPFFGPMVRKVYLARFARSMQLLTASRTPLTEALQLVEKMIALYPMEQALQQVHGKILGGAPLHEALSEHTIFDRRLVSLVKVGEEVNRLDQMFDQLSNQYSEEVEHQTGLISSVIEPAMIVFIAGFVGIILVAMYLPMFKLSGAVG